MYMLYILSCVILIYLHMLYNYYLFIYLNYCIIFNKHFKYNLLYAYYLI